MKKFTLFFVLLASTAGAQQVIHVSQASGSQYQTIQAGINAAQPGDTVLVADGIYFEQVTIMSKKPLLVASHFIIDGDSTHLLNTKIDGSNLTGFYRSAVVFRYVDTTAILAGFTIQGGKGNRSGDLIQGGGINFISSGGKIIHNRIINNVLDGGPFGQNCKVAGGAMYSSSAYSWIVVTDNLIKGNICKSNVEYAFGAGGYLRSDVRFVNNVVRENQSISYGNTVSEGAGFCVDGHPTYTVMLKAINNKFFNNLSKSDLYSDGAGLISVRAENYIIHNEFLNNVSESPNSCGAGIELALTTAPSVIENNLFQANTGNTGTAIDIWLETADSVFIRNNSFIENEGVSGVGIYSQNGTLIIENNIFNKNTATVSGGAILLNKSGTASNTARIINNTFSGNSAELNGGALASLKCNPYLLNNIFWNNTSPEGADIKVSAGDVTIAYCDIDISNVSGLSKILGGIICCDPIFCDTTCLMPDSVSPCLNRGAVYFLFTENDTVFAPQTDILYQPRPLQTGYDIGAYERLASTVDVKDLAHEIQLVIYPNPAKGIVKVQYVLNKPEWVTLSVFDIFGNEKYSNVYSHSAGEYSIPINMQDFSSGSYMISLQLDNGVVTKKIIKL